MVIVVAVVPALLLWAIWRWADGAAAAAENAAPVPVVASQDQSTAALGTGVLSFRRAAGELSRRLNVSAFEVAVQPLLQSVGSRSCAAISLDGRVIGTTDTSTAVIPASNQKLLVAAVALEVLGADHRFVTTLVGPAPVGGVIDGDVVLVGGGDPLLSGDWYATSGQERFPVFNATSLDELARRVVAAGVIEIRGAVLGDGSRYDDEFYVDTWGGGVAGVEAGPYDALMANDSRVLGDDLRGSDPSASAAREFVRVLATQGVVVSGGSGAGAADPSARQIASVESVPLSGVIAEMLTNSDNNTAELLVKEIGFAATGQGTRDAGLAVIASVLAGWGIDTNGLVLGDGSGLSLANRLTCTTLLQVLQRVGVDSPVGQGLAVAGSTGTLTGIFEDTPLAGRLLGKTGTLNNPPFDQDPPAVKALSGYLPVDGGGAIEFVLILNGPTISDQREYRPIWAELVDALVSFPAVAGPAELGPIG